MELQISVFFLFIFFTAGHSRECYDCANTTDSCARPLVTTCPDTHSCYSLTVRQYGNTPANIKYKGCISEHGCRNGSKMFNSGDVSYFCCNTDLCNAKDAPDPIGNSGLYGPNVIYIDTFVNDSNIPITSNNSSGQECYYCVWQNCSKKMSCPANETHCFSATGTFGGLSFNLKGCASMADCDASASSHYIKSISCCEGNLCNGAHSITQSFLFLFCSLLSFILLH